MTKGRRSILIALLLLGYVSAGFATSINFGSLSQLSLVGTAAPLAGGGVRLTDASYRGSDDTPPAGAVWLSDRVPVASGFTISFAFQMSDGNGSEGPDGKPIGGDGLAFVIQNNPYGNQAIGRGAGGIGYMNIWNALAVEFDTYENLPYYGDPDGNHISIQTLGLMPNVPHHRCTDGQLTVPGYATDLPWVRCDQDPSLGSVVVSRPFNDGGTQFATIEYSQGNLSVYLNSAFMLNVPLQLDSLLSLEGNSDAFIGFTAGTRHAYENHDLLWAEFDPPESMPEPSTWILLLSGLAISGLLRNRRRSVR